MFHPGTVRLVGNAGGGGGAPPSSSVPPEPWAAIELDGPAGGGSGGGEAATGTVRVPYAALSAVRIAAGVSERFQFNVDYVSSARERARRKGNSRSGGIGGSK